MRTDTHGHIMIRSFHGRPPTAPEKLLEDLEECGLDSVWVSSIDGMKSRDLAFQKEIHNKLSRIVQRFPMKIRAFCTVNPDALEEGAREVERCISELKFIGVKLHPWLQAVSVVDHPGVDLIAQTAGRYHVPLLIHDGTPPYSTPLQIAHVAEKHPQTLFILGHSGLADLWRDAADTAIHHSNIWLQPTAVPGFVIRSAFQAAGPKRLLFGTDSGFSSAASIRYCLNKFRAALGEKAAEEIITKNPDSILGHVPENL